MQKRYLRERGSSLVESALILPAMLVLFLGIAEVGFFLLSYVQVVNATREGARHGSLCRLNDDCAILTTSVKSAVFSEARLLHMTDGGNTTVAVLPAGLASNPPVGTPITVTVIYKHSTLFASNILPMFPTELPIQNTVVMRFEK